MPRPSGDVRDIAAGLGEPDLQDDILDSQQPVGIEHEEKQLTEEQQIEQLDVLDGLRALQSADPIRWKIYRFGAMDDKYNGYITDLTTAALTQQRMSELFGGGAFKVRGFFSNGKYAAQRTVNIQGDPLLYTPKRESMGTDAPSGGINLTEFMTAQQRIDNARRTEEEKRRDDEERRAERRQQENRNFLLAIGGLVAPIVAAVVGRVAPATTAPASPDLAALITALKPSTPPTDPMESMKNMLGVMTLMRDLLPGGGGDGGGSELAEILKAVGPMAAPVLQQLAANRQGAQPPQRPRVTRPDPTQQPSRPGPLTIDATPVAAPAPVAQTLPGDVPSIPQAASPNSNPGVDLSAPSIPMTVEQQAMFAQMKPQVDALVDMARNGQDPVAVGDMFYDTFMSKAEDGMYDSLCDLFEDPKTLNRIGLFNKGVAEHHEFFVKLQETIIKKIKQEEAQATIQAPQETSPAT